jgi:hypothetical protein
MRRPPPARAGPAAADGRDSAAGGSHSDGESRLGLYADSRALANLGHDVGRGTIATILKQHGIEPAPERQKRTTWREFLKAHWDVLAAADFFTVEVRTARV